VTDKAIHAICGTIMLVTAAMLRVVAGGDGVLVGLAAVGLLVLLTSYSDGPKRTKDGGAG